MMRSLPVLVAAVVLLAPGLASAQGPRPGQPQPVQSIIQGGNQDQPVQIDAATLEVRDKKKVATFSGDVQVVQGDTTMKCQTLVVYYGKEVGLAANAAGSAPKSDSGPTPTSAQNIRRIEARGGVTVVTKDQNASGDLGIYDLQCGGQSGPKCHSRRARRGRYRDRECARRSQQPGRQRRLHPQPGACADFAEPRGRLRQLHDDRTRPLMRRRGPPLRRQGS